MRSILEFFKLEYVDYKKLVSVWLPLLCAILTIVGSILFVFPIWDKLFGKYTYTEDRTLFILIVVSALLVVLGTFFYLKDAVYSIWDFKPYEKDENARKRSHRTLIAFLVLNLLTIFGAAYLVVLSSITMFGADKDFDFLCQMNECINLTIFALFLIADYFFISILKSEIKADTENNKLKQIERSMLNAFTLIDLPGFLGVAVIFILSTNYQHTLNDGFGRWFAVGALTFHLIFTQFIVAYLRTLSLAPADVISNQGIDTENTSVE